MMKDVTAIEKKLRLKKKQKEKTKLYSSK